jgi:glycosyltransferase involved in cell wall biosynthesis
VSLGIFGTTSKARHVVPTKIFQGGAAGCAIVTSDTPPQRAALGDAAVFVPPGDAPALATALRQLATDRQRLAELRAAGYARMVERFTPAAIGKLVHEAAIPPTTSGSGELRPVTAQGERSPR